ncbi:MAG: nickel pincer cofactor biosynthesis protein LarB [bacterium]
MESELRALLEAVRRGDLPLDAALERLKTLPSEDLGFATLDHHRALRRGFPEVVFGQGKTPEQTVAIVARLLAREGPVLATRVDRAAADALMAAHPAGEHDPLSRTVRWRWPEPRADAPVVLVVSAGTSDLPVAEEAAITASTFGCAVERLFDVGVAGLHRLLSQGERLRRAAVIVVVAGMEGALPSVVGGLVDVPVIAVPTSVGYGASFGGLAALLGMLNTCSSGVTVVNIDNGFGAGYAAAVLIRSLERARTATKESE